MPYCADSRNHGLARLFTMLVRREMDVKWMAYFHVDFGITVLVLDGERCCSKTMSRLKTGGICSYFLSARC
jgi:hypothetical protein